MKIIKQILPSLFLISTYGLGITVFTPYISPYLSSLGYSNSTISYMYAIGPISIIALSPILGRISDILGRKKLITVALAMEVFVLSALIYFPLSFARGAALITIGALGVVMLEVNLLSQVEDKVKDKNRGVFTGIYESLRTIGVIAGPLVGSSIVAVAPISTTFKLAIIIFSLILLVNIFTKEKLKTKKKAHLKDLNFVNEIKSFWSNKKLRGIAILGMSTNFASRGSLVFLPLYIVHDLGAPLYYVGIAIAAGMSINLFQFIHGWFCDRKGCERYIILGTSIAAMAYMLISFTENIHALIITMVIFSLGGSMWTTSAVTQVSKIGEKEGTEGQVVSVYGALSSIGVISTFIVSGLIVANFGLRPLFFIYGSVIFLAILISFKYIFSDKKSTQKSPIFDTN